MWKWAIVLLFIALATGYFLRFLLYVPNFESSSAGVSSLSSALEDNAAWTPLFNGEDLENWIAKFSGYPLGVNHRDTFRVEDGLLSVSYADYEQFDGEFGVLFYQQEYSHYILRLEYRFVGEQVPGGPSWAFRNSGVMLHSQAPKTIPLDSDFPVSIEAQLLGGADEGERNTGNLCTPGTHVILQGQLHKFHCTNSMSKTYRGDQWVKAEFEVQGSGVIRHIINDELVIEYEQAQYDPDDADAKTLMRGGGGRLISTGYIALQAESHPVQFRNIEIHVLKP
ncbi:MAG: 3-keto-disaccharide hydrolase [Pseudomonadales bacterium]